MRDRTKMNAMRSGVVVVGALAFGYLTLQLGFKPFLERAQVSLEHSEPASSSPPIESGSNTNRELAFTVPCILVFRFRKMNWLVNQADAEEEDWMAKWDQRRRMAVIQGLCHVAYALYLHQAFYRYHNQSAKSLKGKKRNAPMDYLCKREFENIAEAINSVAEAIREGNTIAEMGQACVYSEDEVFAELVNLGIYKTLRYRAFTFLIQNDLRVRALFVCPIEELKNFLVQLMYRSDNPQYDGYW